MKEEASTEGGVAEELHRIWKHATSDSIAGDIERAERLAASASDAEEEEVAAYLEAIRRLQHWLQDR